MLKDPGELHVLLFIENTIALQFAYFGLCTIRFELWSQLGHWLIEGIPLHIQFFLQTRRRSMKGSYTQVSKHVRLKCPFIKQATRKGSRKEHCMCIKENKTFHRKAFSATLQASTHLFDTCGSAADQLQALLGVWRSARFKPRLLWRYQTAIKMTPRF